MLPLLMIYDMTCTDEIQVVHYLNRAILSPILNPSMSPIGVLVWAVAVIFQVCNGLSIGCWLGGYGPTTHAEWRNHEFSFTSPGKIEFGILIWALGLIGNIYHDDELRDIRRVAMRKQQAQQREQDDSTGKGKKYCVEKVYMIPENGMFKWVLFPHYLCEWVEWAGFWVAAGWGCTPARNFLVNEITTMFARAIEGKAWYVKKFGREKVGKRKAIIPGII